MAISEKFYVQVSNHLLETRWFTAFANEQWATCASVADGLVIGADAYGTGNPGLDGARKVRVLRRSDFVSAGDIAGMLRAEQDLLNGWPTSEVPRLPASVPLMRFSEPLPALTWDFVSRDVETILGAFKSLTAADLESVDTRLVLSDVKPETRIKILGLSIQWNESPASTIARLLDQYFSS